MSRVQKQPPGLGKILNAFAPESTDESESPPKLGLLPASAESGVRQLISQFGKEAVLAAVKGATKAKRGRKAEKDWPLLKPYIQADAADWLAGRDPIQLRSHYSIAQAFAKEHPGHNQTATATRVMKKLSDKRRWMSLATAQQSSDEGYPYTVHLRVMELLADTDEIWSRLLEYARNDVARYRENVGEPSPEMSFSEIKKASQNALMPLNALGRLSTLGGMFGGRAKP